MPRDTKFWDRIAAKYAAKPVGDEKAYQHKLSVTQGYFQPDMNVLEFGCGTGSTALIHAAKVKFYTAVDISPAMIEIAKSKSVPSGAEGLAFKVATLEDYAQQNAAYDMVLGLSILHLLDNLDETLKTVHQILKPGGFFVTSTPCLADNMFYLKLIIPLMRLFKLAPKVYFLKRGILEKKLENLGFETEYRWSPPKNPSTLFLIARKSTKV